MVNQSHEQKLIPATMALIGAAILLLVVLRRSPPPAAPNERNESQAGPSPIAETQTRPAAASDQPDREITADGKLKATRHKDETGRVPLELVETPQGTVQIRRTFSNDGQLLREQAFLDGSPVPVPSP